MRPADRILSRNYFDAKVNCTASDKQQIWGKYGRMWATIGRHSRIRHRRRSRPARRGSRSGRHAHPGGHDRPFAAPLGPNLLLDGVIGYERQDQHVTPNDFGTNYGQQFGIPNANGPGSAAERLPEHQQSPATPASASRTGCRCARVEESYTHSDNLTWTKGAHELRFGFDLVRHHLNHWQPEIGNGRSARRPGLQRPGRRRCKGGAAPNQFNAYAAFLLGLSDDAEKSLQYILMTGREWQFGWYVRDRWQVSRKLTVNIGLRYEYYPLMTRAGKGIERL